MLGRLVSHPVGTLHQTVGSIVHEGLRSLLAGFGDAVAPLVVGVGIYFVRKSG